MNRALVVPIALLVAVGCGDGNPVTEPTSPDSLLRQTDRLRDTVGTFHINPADPTFVTLPAGSDTGVLQYFGSRTADGGLERLLGVRRALLDDPATVIVRIQDEHARPTMIASETGDRLHFQYLQAGSMRMTLALADGVVEATEFSVPGLAYLPASATDLVRHNPTVSSAQNTPDVAQLKIGLKRSGGSAAHKRSGKRVLQYWKRRVGTGAVR